MLLIDAGNRDTFLPYSALILWNMAGAAMSELLI